MSRIQIKNKEINQAIEDVRNILAVELERKGRGSFASSHETYGVILEEVDEYWDAVKKSSAVGQREELIDIAVAALFGLACLDSSTLDWV